MVFYVGGYPDDFRVNMHFFLNPIGFCWGKVLLKVMHYDIVFLYNKVTIAFLVHSYGK